MTRDDGDDMWESLLVVVGGGNALTGDPGRLIVIHSGTAFHRLSVSSTPITGATSMRTRFLTVTLAAAAVALIGAAEVTAQAGASRYGVWQMQSDAPPPSKNIMTYEPYGDGGMKITVASTNARGEDNEWSYTTMFDGEFRPVQGQENAATAVEVIDDRSTRILNQRAGRVTQVIVNTLSEDGNTISNEYVRMDQNGKITAVTHAVYKRIG